MKVLAFIHSLGAGGAERVTALLANHWAKKGMRVTIVTLAARSLDRYALDAGIERIALEQTQTSRSSLAGARANIGRVMALRRILRNERPDVAMAMMTNSNVLLALSAIGLRGIRTVGSERIHPALLPLGTAWTVLRSYGYALLDSVIAQTTKTRDWLVSNTRARNVVVIPNPVVWPLERAAPTIDPHRVGDSDRKRVLAVGRLVHQKGFDILVDVFAQLASELPRWELAIVGRGSDEEALRSRIAAHSLEDKVFLVGDVGNIGDWYEAADIFVLSSRFEGFPNALAEAMAYGVASVSFDCDTGPGDLIQNEVNGLLVPVGDAPALRGALQRLMNEPALRARLAARSVEVRDRFALNTVSNAWLDLFRSLVTQP
jgi:glycosyltransferase involved in cell wall biosynthesis